jgi:SAM-dependent methyltransferase
MGFEDEGTGRNFPFLRDAVGPEGRIYGVDLSEGMLRRARKLCQRRQWTNFVLIETDAADYAGEELFDGALFSFSYNVMPHHRFVLRQASRRPTRYRGCETTPRALWKADSPICHLVDEADAAWQSSYSTLAIPCCAGR